MTETDTECSGSRHCSAERQRWWCVVDFYDESPDVKFFLVQTGTKDLNGQVRTDPGQVRVDHERCREFWERYNEMQAGACPFLVVPDNALRNRVATVDIDFKVGGIRNSGSRICYLSWLSFSKHQHRRS